MKKMTRLFALATLSVLFFAFQPLSAQSVLDPTDPVITYDPNTPPPAPPFGEIVKWVRTVRLGWNTSSYKAYHYNGSSFRLKFPRTYNPTANDGKKYPLMIFFHGLGERGGIYDNEYHLLHGGDFFRQSVDNNRFDGYILALQSDGSFGNNQFQRIVEIINYMVTNNKLDPFQISVNGLSAGGQASWDMMINYPQYVTSMLPMSWSSILYLDQAVVEKARRLPIWIFQGGVDGNPAPYTTEQVRNAIQNAGGNFKYTLYPTLGHGTWNTAWSESDFWNFQKRAYASNPWPLNNRFEFCPGELINATLVLPAGMSAYEWRKDGVLIPGANSSTLAVSVTGTYSARVQRNGIWSEWSRVPVVVRIKPPTVSPDITVSGLASRVLPAVDGSTSVRLEVPEGYATYNWQRVGNATTLSTNRFLTVSTPGEYRIRVTEQFGCSSDFSAPFAVVNANGSARPAEVIGLRATATSQTSIRLDWADVPTPAYNETNFEVYQGLQQGGPYTLIGLTGADVRKFIINGLNANTSYFYKVRAVNLGGASAPSEEVTARTGADQRPPTAPGELTVISTTRNSAQLRWRQSLDDVGVQKYEIYQNNQLVNITTDTTFIVSGLTPYQTYNFKVAALDQAGNRSPFSNQATAQTTLKGLNYKYYTFTGTWNNLPDFATLTPVVTGTMPNVAITPRTQNDNFAFLWEGYITIPTTGVYAFRTNSDDGSRVWLGALNGTGSPYSFSGASIVNNDGLHGSQDRTSVDLNLTAGVYPIAIAFYEQGGGESMTLTWKTPSSNGAFAAVPNAQFGDAPQATGPAPGKPTGLSATPVSYSQINLSWTDNSTDETGFEIWRSTQPFSGFLPVGQVGANITTFSDTALGFNVRYYYRVRAVGVNGESEFDTPGQGLDYTYHEQNSLTVLPNFNTIPVVATGRVANVGLGVQRRNDNFQLRFTGTINIPTTGLYTFYLTSDAGSKLYIGGYDETKLVVNHDGLHSATEKAGTRQLARGAYQFDVTYFEVTGSEALSLRIAGPGITKQLVPNTFFGVPPASAITLAPVTAPSFPSNLVATGLSKTAIQVTWQDRATTESAYELYRSSGDNSDYILYATLPANTTAFQDTGLYANGVFYYKVRAVNIGGNSVFTNEDSARTFNSRPSITALPNRSARFGQTTVLRLKATDPDGDALVFTTLNLPSFVTLVDSGNRAGSLVVSPSSAQQGTYADIHVIASDPFGGADTTVFTLTVNANHDPVIGAIVDYTVIENNTLSIPLSATDQNGTDILAWSVTGLPASFTLTPSANGSATLFLQPGYAAAGTYLVTVQVHDGNGGYATRQFNLTVTDKNPNRRIYVRFGNGTAIGTPWNTATSPTTNNLRDEANVATGINLNMETDRWFTRNDGPSTGNNSGVYPDAVLQSYFYCGTWWTTPTVNGVLSNLDPAKRYNLTFHGGTVWHELTSDNGNTQYTVGSKTVTLPVENNTANTVSINNIQPAANGTITFTVAKGAGAEAAILNSVVIYELQSDGTLPLAPASLIAQNLPSQGVKLLWEDRSYNEGEFEIYRAAAAAGPFTLMGTASAEAITYLDRTASGFTTYYYRIRAVNGAGASAYSNTVKITSPNRVPQISTVNNINIANNQTRQIAISAADDAVDQITFTTRNLPFFVTLSGNGNGEAVLNVNPTKAAIGLYRNVSVTATDNHGASSTTTFDILVRDNQITRVYLNFSDGALYGERPWNNLSGWPFAAATYGNIRNENDAATTIGVNLMDGFTGMGQVGASARNGKDQLPENVIRTGYFESSSNTRRVMISGLSTNKRYNFIFFSSRGDGNATNTSFRINTQTVTINGTYNIDRSVQINGVQPTDSGKVIIFVSKVGSAAFAMFNDLIIEEYDPAVVPLMGPTNLVVTDQKLNSISLHWQDRASNETGYEIYRAPAGGNYTLLTTTASNVNSYTDNNLPADRSYYYLVRALNGAAASSYSNAVLGYTYANTVQVNFSNNQRAGVPWNNTAMPPQTGSRWNNFNDNNNTASSISMTNLGAWDGPYDAGVNTGNNSGIFPDAVMLESYGLFPGSSATLRVSGLKANMRYDFLYFASSIGTGDVTSAYTVGNQSVILNAAQNRSGTVTMYSVVADDFGNAEITVTPGTAGSSFGLIGALVIQGYTPVSGSEPSPLGRVIPEALTLQEAPAGKAPAVYPNPFESYFIVALESKQATKATVSVFDVNGKAVHRQDFTGIVPGTNALRIQPAQALSRGIYFVRIQLAGHKEEQVIRLIKQ
jgi:predicted esterase